MWPDSDPGAAVNNLSQTVFQLRRTLDPGYRGGESAQYVLSAIDIVGLNPELILTDLVEFRRLRSQMDSDSLRSQELATALVALVHGQFLAELRYEDWVNRLQTSIHAEIRQTLLPVATGEHHVPRDLCIRAASALIELDEFDDLAYAAMARHLSLSGRKIAARDLISRYARRLELELDERPSAELAALLAELRPDTG